LAFAPDQSYLVQWIQKAFFQASTLSEADIHSGTQSQKRLSAFLVEAQDSPRIVSDFDPDFFELFTTGFTYRNLFVERIIAHREIRTEARIPKELLHPSVYLPGLPLDEMPNVEPVLECGSAFPDDDDCPVSTFLRRDGLFTFGKKFEDAAPIVPMPAEPEEKIEFFIKWMDLPVCEATWEPQETLTGAAKPFTIANVAEFEVLKTLYWGHVRGSRSSPIPLSVDRLVFKRGIELTADQKLIVESLITCFRQGKHCHIATGPESGRVLAVVAFVSLLRSTPPQPVLVVTSEESLESWISTIKVVAGLTWTGYVGDESDRLLMRHHEFGPPPTFDILITTAEIYYTGTEYLMGIEWKMIVADRIQKKLDCFDIFTARISNSATPKPDFHSVFASDAQPLSISQDIIFVPHPVATFIHSWMRGLLKTKGIRQSIHRSADQMFAQIGIALGHPFLIKQFEAALTLEHQRSLGIPETSELSQAQHSSFFGSVSGKLQRLPDLVRTVQRSVIVALNFKILRFIHKFLHSRHISSALLNSNLSFECATSKFSKGCLLMTRDFHSPILDQFKCELLIFYDVGFTFQDDLNIIRFLTRTTPIRVYRLLTSHSVEADLFLRSISQQTLNYCRLDIREADSLLRIAAITTHPDKEPLNPPSLSFAYPDDTLSLPQLLGSAQNETEIDDFWPTVFALVRPPKPVRDSSWTATQGFKLVRRMSVLGVDRLSDFDVGLPPTETVSFSQSILLAAMAHVPEEQLPLFNVAGAIVLCALFPDGPIGDPEDDLLFWAKRASDDPLLKLAIFKAGRFANFLRAQATTFLRDLERGCAVRAFLSVRPPDDAPTRFVVRSGEFESARTVRIVLALFAELGPDWREIAERSGDVNADVLRSRFPALHSAVLQDVLSAAFKSEDSDDRYLRPFRQVLTKGPFSRSWSEAEAECVAKALFGFGVPLGDGREPDWREFHALCKVTSKRTATVCEYATALIGAVKSAPPGADVAVEGLVLSANAVAKRRTRIAMLGYVRELSARPLEEFRGQVGLPPGWGIGQDRALLAGICRFGFARIGALAAAVDDRSLSGFGEFLVNRDAVVQRIRIIAVSNLALARTVAFWSGPVRSVAFVGTRESGVKRGRRKKEAEVKETTKGKGKEKVNEKVKEKEKETEKVRKAFVPKPPPMPPPPRPKPKPKTRVVFQYDTVPKKIVFVD
jgi:hypothetical protein